MAVWLGELGYGPPKEVGRWSLFFFGSRLEAIATRVEAIAIRVEAITTRVEVVGGGHRYYI